MLENTINKKHKAGASGPIAGKDGSLIYMFLGSFQNNLINCESIKNLEICFNSGKEVTTRSRMIVMMIESLTELKRSHTWQLQSGTSFTNSKFRHGNREQLSDMKMN